jgi:hypothetical protein
MQSATYRSASALLLLCASAACTRPAPNPPGVEEPPTFHPERSIATLPTTSEPAGAVPPAYSHVDPDAMGTTRTPLAPDAYPMDSRLPNAH